VGYHPLYGLFEFWEEGVVWQVLAVEVGFEGLEIHHASRDNCCSVSCATELENFTYHISAAFATGSG
jgi:hypothetical protein